MIHPNTIRATLAATALAFGLSAHAVELTVGYQTVPTPSQVPQADGAYEKATGAKINWRKFDDGAEVINAVASGDVQIAYLGSSPLAAAASRKLSIETFLIAAELGTSEELVVRNGSGIGGPQDLVGKKIAVPFVSTGHYSLLAALKHWKIDPKKVEIVNLSPPNIIAAWARGDIDGTYVWDPAVVAAFAKVTLDSFAAYNKDPKAWSADKANIDKIVKITGAKAEEVPGVLAGSGYLSPAEQLRTLGEPTAKALANTSAFLKEQGRIDAPLTSYAPYTNAAYVKAAGSL